MKTVIKIDRKTVRRNPDYEPGRYASFAQGLPEFWIKIKGDIPEYLINKVRVSSVTYGSDHPVIQNTLLIGDLDKDLAEILYKDPQILSIERYSEIIDITTIDEPMYLYDYIPTEIECNTCGKIFLHNKLESDSLYETYSNQICPYCRDWYCCDIDFEELTNDELEKLCGLKTC